jgi:RecJ-like exonuclease
MIKKEAHDIINREYDNIISLYPYDENINAEISCNDCEFKGEVSFHPFGLKCGGCGGYNTVKMR